MSAAQIAKELGVSVPTVYHHLSSGSTNPVGGKPGRPPKNPVVSLVDISQRRQELAEQAAALQRKLTELQETEERLRESARMKFEIVGDNVVIRKNQEEVTVSFADVEELHKAVTMPATMTA
jgi:AcrR family transcriptional regulator